MSGGDVLSQAEVESLLSAMEQTQQRAPAARKPTPPSASSSPSKPREKVTPYDFKRPERVGKAQGFVKIVRDAGYRGYLPIETLPVVNVKYEPLKVVPRFHAEVQAAFNRS